MIYKWELIAEPEEGSGRIVGGATYEKVNFSGTMAGEYRLALSVSDGDLVSTRDIVIITVESGDVDDTGTAEIIGEIEDDTGDVEVVGTTEEDTGDAEIIGSIEETTGDAEVIGEIDD